MFYKEIPGFDRPVSLITFGGASLSGEGGGYGFGEMSESAAEKLLKTSWEAGITLYDTAPIYGFGLSEERLGRYLPKEAMVISKSGVDWHETKRVNMSNARAITEKMLTQSLRRLKREAIDLYMIHWPDPKVDLREPLEVLLRAQEKGMIKNIGLCNTNPEDLRKAKSLCHVSAIQSELNLFNQAPFTSLGDEWKECLSMSWGTFDKGILTGRVTPERKFTKDDARSWAPWWNKKIVLEKIRKVNELKVILSDYGIGPMEFCLSYNLNYFGVDTCLVGLKTDEDVFKCASALQEQIMRERIEEVVVRLNHRS